MDALGYSFAMIGASSSLKAVIGTIQGIGQTKIIKLLGSVANLAAAAGHLLSIVDIALKCDNPDNAVEAAVIFSVMTILFIAAVGVLSLVMPILAWAASILLDRALSKIKDSLLFTQGCKI